MEEQLMNNEQQTPVESLPSVENSATPVVKENAREQSTENIVDEGATNIQSEANSKPVEETLLKIDTPNAKEDIELLKKQLDEYKLKEEEVKQLSSRLGTTNFRDMQIFEANKQLDIIDNQAQQAYISLCNQYGVDYRPDKIEASANELKSKDPQAYYDLNYKLNQLDNVVNQQRNEIQNFVRNREIQLSAQKYNKVLNASPVLRQQLNNYLTTVNPANPSKDIDMFMQIAQSIQAEAFEYGKLFAQQEAKKVETSPETILNNNSIVQGSNGGTTTGAKPLTMADIEKMDLATYSKYATEIDRLRSEGRL